MTAYFPPEVWDAIEPVTPEAAARAPKRRGAPDDIWLRRYAMECSAYIHESARRSIPDHPSPGSDCLTVGQWLTVKPSTGDTRYDVWRRYAKAYAPLQSVQSDGTLEPWDWQELFR